MRFTLVGSDGDIDFNEANLNLAVRWGEGPGDLEGVALGEAQTQIVAAPGARADSPWIAWPGDPAPEGEARETQFSVGDAGTAISAAAAGLGKARVPLLLAESAIASGRVAALAPPEPNRRGYWLVAPLPQWRQKKVRALVAALVAEPV
jgi:LysR family glycine cleavage system transcriptional activator